MFSTTTLRRTAAVAIVGAASLLTAAGSASAAEAVSATDKKAGPEPRIVGGYVPHPTQWPWIAAVGHARAARPDLNPEQRQFCGGTLIAARVVITAAHCVVDDGVVASASRLGVVVGRRNLNEAGGEELNVVGIAVHPQYNERAITSDVALLRLATPSSRTPAALDPGFQLTEGLVATVMGWGDTYSGSHQGSADLLAADIAIWSSDRCVAHYADYQIKHDPSTQLCAGWAEGGVSSCQGDSGGPLMVRDTAGTWRLIGIVSWADRCAIAGRPSNFSWVGAPTIRPWIVATTAQLSVPDPAPAAAPAPAPVRTATVTVRRPRAAVSRVSVRGRTLRFSLNRAARVTIRVTGRTRRTIRRSGRAGRNKVRLPRGARRLRITATAADGTRAIVTASLRR
jgi:secreted trypsin-like serine protease